MTIYFLVLTIIFAFVTGHAISSWRHTGEWFYRCIYPIFGVWTVMMGILVIYLSH